MRIWVHGNGTRNDEQNKTTFGRNKRTDDKKEPNEENIPMRKRPLIPFRCYLIKIP